MDRIERMTDVRELAFRTHHTTLAGEFKNRVLAARTTRRTVNTQPVDLFWSAGHDVATQQERPGWWSGVIRRRADGPRNEFPGVRGFSARNVHYMATFTRAWVGNPSAQRVVSQLVACYTYDALQADVRSDLPNAERLSNVLDWVEQA